MRALVPLCLLLACSAEPRTEPRANERITLATAPYTLAPGEEKYLCYATTLAGDREIAVNGFTSDAGALVHHVVLSYTTSPEPDGVSECAVRFKPTWFPLFEIGRSSGNLSLPAGTAMRFRGQQLLIQLHLVNATKASVTETSRIHLETLDPATKTTNAGIYGFDNRVFSIPPKSMGTSAEMSCTMTRDMTVFAVLGHMHARGSRIELMRGDAVLFATDWSFDVQPTTPLAIQVHKGDNIRLRCTWTNDGDTVVGYGERASDEMCSLIWYYTPYEALDGCAKAP